MASDTASPRASGGDRLDSHVRMLPVLGHSGADVDLALMQPYLFPYLGSFSLVAATDIYVFFDNVQYIRRGWMHRNRIHKPGGGWQYFGVPVVKAPRHTPIHAVQLSGAVDWRSRTKATLRQTYGSVAPRFDAVMGLVEDAIDPPVDGISELNIRSFDLCCTALGLDLNVHRAASLDLTEPEHPWGWAVAACKKLGASRYVNPPGGAALYPPEPFAQNGLKVGILRPQLLEYDRAGLPWEPGLSVLDALMFNPPEAVRRMVDAATVEWQTSGRSAST